MWLWEGKSLMAWNLVEEGCVIADMLIKEALGPCCTQTSAFKDSSPRVYLATTGLKQQDKRLATETCIAMSDLNISAFQIIYTWYFVTVTEN